MSEKVVVVTGAGSGIGRTTARAFAARGAEVVLVERRLEPLVADVAEADRIVEFVRSRYGRLDVLVNDAGIVRGDHLGRSRHRTFPSCWRRTWSRRSC